MNKIHEENREGSVIINGVEYVPKNAMDISSITDISVIIEKVVSSVISKVGLNGNQEFITREQQTTSAGFDGLPGEKKGSELSAMLYDKLPKGMRQGSRFRSFYTDFERSTGIKLYDFHKERMVGMTTRERGKYPYRKADSIFMVADESTVFEYAKQYEFRFGN